MGRSVQPWSLTRTHSSSKDDCSFIMRMITTTYLRLTLIYSHTSRDSILQFCSLSHTGQVKATFIILSHTYTQTLGSQSHCHSLTLTHTTANHTLSLSSASQPITFMLLTSLKTFLHYFCDNHFSIHDCMIKWLSPSAAKNLMYYIRQIYTRSLG